MAIMGTDTMVTTPTVIMDTGAGSRTSGGTLRLCLGYCQFFQAYLLIQDPV